ncbi:NAD-dependent DNA ligase LigA [Lyticum sinuosum]|nr:NAD-dependent DNA ligase LigA [Lyticum sinuosum]
MFNKKNLIEKIQSLRQEIIKHNRYYYSKNKPIITDLEYDSMRRELEMLAKQFGDMKLADIDIGYPPSNRFNRIRHTSPMLSLANAFNEDEVKRFVKRIEKYTEKSNLSCNYICEPKIDGVSFAAIYYKGNLIAGLTRGDGKHGEDITQSLYYVNNLPRNINCSDLIEVRGEIYIDKKDFISLNENRKSSNEQQFVSPRNAASGSLRHLNTSQIAERRLKYMIWDLFILEEDQVNIVNFNNKKQDNVLYDINIDTIENSLKDKLVNHSDSLLFANNLGFTTVPYYIAKDFSDMMKYHQKIEEERPFLDYDIDGVVYKINEIKVGKFLGSTNHSPRWAIAHKFTAETALTELINIVFQVSRNGILTPVAELKPILINGVTVSRVSLHNIDEINRLKLYLNCKVEIKRAGDVIPKITRVIFDNQVTNNNPILELTDIKCPECHNKAIFKSPYLYCDNYACPAQIIEKMIHFSGRSCFNIIGLGKKQIKQLYQLNIIENCADIMEIPDKLDLINKIKNQDGWGDKSVNDLIDSIKKARIVSFANFIYAMGIPNIGYGIASILSDKFHNIKSLVEIQNKEELQIKSKLGEKTSEYLWNFISNILKPALMIESSQNKIEYEEKSNNIKITLEIETLTRLIKVITIQ